MLPGSEISSDKQDLGRFLSQIAPVGKDIATAKGDGVRLMSMTSSKGLTAKATIIIGVDNDFIPRPGQDRAEERRLLYVAMTRSQEMLFLTWSQRREGPAARLGHLNMGLRRYTDFLRGGPIESQDGSNYVQSLFQNEQYF